MWNAKKKTKRKVRCFRGVKKTSLPAPSFSTRERQRQERGGGTALGREKKTLRMFLDTVVNGERERWTGKQLHIFS